MIYGRHMSKEVQGVLHPHVGLLPLPVTYSPVPVLGHRLNDTCARPQVTYYFSCPPAAGKASLAGIKDDFLMLYSIIPSRQCTKVMLALPPAIFHIWLPHIAATYVTLALLLFFTPPPPMASTSI